MLIHYALWIKTIIAAGALTAIIAMYLRQRHRMRHFLNRLDEMTHTLGRGPEQKPRVH